VIARLAAESERVRVLECFIETVADLGYNATSLEAILARTGIDEETFHRHFADKEECFLAAWDYITGRAKPRALAAFESRDTWVEQMRAVGESLYDYYAVKHPAHARIVYVEGPSAGERARERVAATLDVFTELIDRGRQELDDPDSLTRATAEGLAGAVYEQAAVHFMRRADADLSELVPQLMFTVVCPYVGVEEAMKELRRLP
jgi:AcrR family transcriptional regulator